MTVIALITFKAQPGQREAMAAAMHDIQEQLDGVDGFVGITSYNAVDDADTIIELAEWESVATHGAFRARAGETGLFEPLAAVSAGPPSAIYIEQR